jgi:hypothetical protein
VALEWTQSDVDALKAAVKSGVLTVSYSGPPARQITYQSLDAMRKLLASMNASVEDAAGNRVKSRRPVYRKMGRTDE